MPDGKWCPENDGAYRAEMAELHRGSVEARHIRKLKAANDRADRAEIALAGAHSVIESLRKVGSS